MKHIFGIMSFFVLASYAGGEEIFLEKRVQHTEIYNTNVLI